MRQALACQLGGVVALAAGSLIPAAPVNAQTATACATASCELAQQTALTTLLQPFTTLPGTAAWTANYEVQQSIYLNSTYAQRVQSAQNSVLANAQNLIWLSNNNPSPFAAQVRAALANATVMAEFNAAYAVPHTAAQPTYLKHFTGYTMYQTYGLAGPYGVYNIDPHPFQTSAAIAATTSALT